jgi:hypothetical protein
MVAGRFHARKLWGRDLAIEKTTTTTSNFFRHTERDRYSNMSKSFIGDASTAGWSCAQARRTGAMP